MTNRISNPSDRFSDGAGEMSGERADDGSDLDSDPHFFEPPYPNRDNPFVYPAESDRSTAGPVGTSVAEIQVMGFANTRSNADSNADSPVDESKVLLKTNVGIKLLAVGEQVGQIKVLRIDSPTVELQMGSLIWTATMFDR